MAKKKVKRVSRPMNAVRSSKKPTSQIKKSNAMKVVVKNFSFFLILFVITVVLGFIFTNEMLDNLFWILSMLTGFVAVALLIVMLILFFVRAFNR